MAALELIPQDIRERFELHEWKHACAILATDFPEEWRDLIEMLRAFRLCRTWITNPGGNKSRISQFVDVFLGERGWVEKHFNTQVQVDQVVMASPTHDVDCYKNRVALEVEWNNKDPFYDRDLNNFRLLFDLRAISVGIIFTRCDQLQTIFNQLGRGTSYGASTTHMSKLLPRVVGGSGAGCPLLVIGISNRVYDENC